MFLKKNFLVEKLPSCPFLIAGLLGDKRMFSIKVLVRTNDLRGMWLTCADCGYPHLQADAG